MQEEPNEKCKFFTNFPAIQHRKQNSKLDNQNNLSC